MTTIGSRTATAKKAYRCDQCDGRIEAGERYLKEAGTWDGFQVYRAHPSCHRAAMAYHRLCRLNWDEGVRLADDVCSEDAAWMAEHHPAVAIRFNFVLTPYF